MSVQEIGAIASMANTIGVVAILLIIVRVIDAGRWVRGVDLKSVRDDLLACHREIRRLNALLAGRRSTDQADGNERGTND